MRGLDRERGVIDVSKIKTFDVSALSGRKLELRDLRSSDGLRVVAAFDLDSGECFFLSVCVDPVMEGE